MTYLTVCLHDTTYDGGHVMGSADVYWGEKSEGLLGQLVEVGFVCR